MIFSALRTIRNRKPSLRLQSITVVESPELPFSLGEELSKVLQRNYVDRREGDSKIENHHGLKAQVVSRAPGFNPASKREKMEAGRILYVSEILEEMAGLDHLSRQGKAELIGRALSKLREDLRGS